MFRKVAQVQSLATFTVAEDGGFKVSAQLDGPRASHFLGDGARVFDFQGLLDRVATNYGVSSKPTDYFFEAIRANTTNVPNENNDAFHRSELLRFDVKLGMPVYMTYSGKPHHLNHRTENPKAARGVILDSYYNDSSPPLPVCPSCTTKTAERQNRDETGLHCKKCGTVVKDEFVEILVAIDAAKDKRFAEAVRKGQLRAGSMGCNCLSTTCNVCHHVAYAKPEFCEHIRAGNKGTLWKREGSRWAKTNVAEVKRELQRRRVAYVPHDFCFVKAGDFEVRRAYENCCGVVFDEYSRVDQPADPKALQVEILKAASLEPTAEQLAAETEALIRSAEAHQQRAAQRLPRLPRLMDQHGVGIQLEPGDDPLVIEPPMTNMEEAPGMAPAPSMPGAPPGAAPGVSIDQYTENEVAPQGPPAGEEMDLGEMGILPTPPGASAPRKGLKMRTFDAAYRKWTVQISEQGNARLVTANKEQVLLIRGQPMNDPEARRTFGRQIYASLVTDGLLATAKKFNAIFAPRFAQVAEGGANDMVGFDDHEMFGSPLEGGDPVNDMQGVDREKTAPASTRDEAAAGDDMDGDVRGTPPDMVTEDGAADHERSEMGIDNVTEPDGSDMREKRKPVSLGSDSVLKDITVDHKEPVTNKKSYTLGATFIQKDDPKHLAFRLVGTQLARVASEVQNFGAVSYILERGVHGKPGHAWHRVSEKDLGALWRQLDKKPGTLKLPSAPVGAGVQAAAKCDKCGEKKEADHKCKTAAVEPSTPTRDVKFAERVQKITAAKLRKAEEAVARAAREAEEKVALAKGAAVDSFTRALRIAARRHQVDLEPSPIKMAADAVLSTPREIGKDAATGEPIVFHGLDPELTRYLVAQLFEVGHDDHLESLITRAAELMKRGEQYLLDAEADAQNLKPTLPVVTASAAQVDDVGLNAEMLRRQAREGNLHITPAPATLTSANGHDRRTAIRGALGGTVVGAARGRLGLNN